MKKQILISLILISLVFVNKNIFGQDLSVPNGKLNVFYNSGILSNTDIDDEDGIFGTNGISENNAGDLHLRGFWGVVIDKNGGDYGEHPSYFNGVNPAGGCFAVRTRIDNLSFRTDFMIRNNGNVGIGTTAPSEKLEVNGKIKVNGEIHCSGTYGISCGGMQINGTSIKKFGIYNDHWNTSSRKLIFMPANAAGTGWDWWKQLEIDGVDGTMTKYVVSPNAKAFSVYEYNIAKDVFRVMGNGKVYATEVNVLLAANFPDYVFAKDYKLMNLSDLEQYINANKHLPGVPSAKEVASNGNSINLGEMQTILLEKIEGLTLYTIEQQKQMSIQQKQIDAQKELLQKQQATIDLLMQKLQE